MAVGAASFCVLALFMAHEFEEIVRVLPWIRRHSHDPRFARDIWIVGRDAYPTTEVVALAIAEEFVLASVALAVAIVVAASTVVVALATVNALHLLGHLAAAFRVRAWNPGSVTAAVTLPPNVAIVVVLLLAGASPLWSLAAVVVVGAVFAANLSWLHRAAPAMARRIAER